MNKMFRQMELVVLGSIVAPRGHCCAWTLIFTPISVIPALRFDAQKFTSLANRIPEIALAAIEDVVRRNCSEAGRLPSHIPRPLSAERFLLLDRAGAHASSGSLAAHRSPNSPRVPTPNRSSAGCRSILPGIRAASKATHTRCSTPNASSSWVKRPLAERRSKRRSSQPQGCDRVPGRRGRRNRLQPLHPPQSPCAPRQQPPC